MKTQVIVKWALDFLLGRSTSGVACFTGKVLGQVPGRFRGRFREGSREGSGGGRFRSRFREGSRAGSEKVPGQVPGRFRGRFRKGSGAGSGKVPGEATLEPSRNLPDEEHGTNETKGTCPKTFPEGSEPRVSERFRGRFRTIGSGKVPGQFFERRVPGSGNGGFREGSGAGSERQVPGRFRVSFGVRRNLNCLMNTSWLVFFWLFAAWVKSRAERPSVSGVNRQLHVQIGCKLGIRNRKDELTKQAKRNKLQIKPEGN